MFRFCHLAKSDQKLAKNKKNLNKIEIYFRHFSICAEKILQLNDESKQEILQMEPD